MTTRDELLTLADRCERATGADRLLGREVLLACGFGYVSPLQRWMDPTASLDAAMTLTEGAWRRINVDPNGRANVRLGDACAVTAATPALALTAAALRSRAGAAA